MYVIVCVCHLKHNVCLVILCTGSMLFVIEFGSLLGHIANASWMQPGRA